MTNSMTQALRISTFAALAALATGCADTAPSEQDSTYTFSPQDNADIDSAPQPMVEGSVCIATDTFAPRFVDERFPLAPDDAVYIEVLGAFACEVERVDDRFILRPERDADSFEDVARCKLGPLVDGEYEIVVEGLEGARFPLAVPSMPTACLPPLVDASDRMVADLTDAAASPEPVELDRPALDGLSPDAAAELRR